MKASKRVSWILLAMVMVTITFAPPRPSAQTAATKSSSERATSSAAQWSIQVDKVNPGGVNIEPAFRVAIYENLLDELGKAKRFQQVFRDGDRTASTVPNLVILKTTVEKYTAGSETRRAVTTVSGATKLNVRSQLCTRDGRIILERTVNGSVRFLGSNLRATHNLARNVAKTIEQSSLPEPSLSTFERSSEALEVMQFDLWQWEHSI